ncbi:MULTISPECIES: hypothetical protein [Emticicia]|uniref:hypothetical protein n=1 Tax=Emticicia TaxID=312278 RepID=UPI0007D8B6B0|nr:MULTISPECIES: hypothetical protein [Emticicia]
METLIYKASTAVHVLCGILSLLAGLVAMITNKGGKVHNRAGMVFYWSMFMIFITTSIFFILYPTNLKYQFFLGIGIVSFYPNWSGKRMLAMKKGLIPTLTDKVGAWSIGISGICMWAYGVFLTINPAKQFGSLNILFFIFGTVSVLNAYGDLRLYLGYVKPEKMHWFFAHAGKMMGAYTAAITAFCVNIVPRFLPDNTPSFVFILTWTAPGVILGILSARIIKKYKVKFKMAEKPSLSAKLKQLFAKKELV